VPGREAFDAIRERIDHDKVRCYRCAD